MAYTLTETFRTKTEAREAVKRGAVLHIVRPDGTVLDRANGDGFPITGKLAHYKEWTGRANVWNGVVKRVV
jgi:predicted ThiF/HesA family dinucleotide-utilizing enzyme